MERSTRPCTRRSCTTSRRSNPPSSSTSRPIRRIRTCCSCTSPSSTRRPRRSPGRRSRNTGRLPPDKPGPRSSSSWPCTRSRARRRSRCILRRSRSRSSSPRSSRTTIRWACKLGTSPGSRRAPRSSQCRRPRSPSGTRRRCRCCIAGCSNRGKWRNSCRRAGNRPRNRACLHPRPIRRIAPKRRRRRSRPSSCHRCRRSRRGRTIGPRTRESTRRPRLRLRIPRRPVDTGRGTARPSRS